jgi:hypothetical protein
MVSIIVESRAGFRFLSYGFCRSQPEAATATHLPSHPLTFSTENAPSRPPFAPTFKAKSMLQAPTNPVPWDGPVAAAAVPANALRVRATTAVTTRSRSRLAISVITFSFVVRL